LNGASYFKSKGQSGNFVSRICRARAELSFSVAVTSSTFFTFSEGAPRASTGRATLSLVGFAEPRIEPEIVFKLALAPTLGMDETALLDCVDWVAHGFEIVQSIFPGWKFSAPDTVAAFGLHGALLIGPRHSIAAHAEDWSRTLSTSEIDLKRDGTVVDHGRAMNVLGGPVSALRHLIDTLARDQVNPPLAAGEIITTGTLTRALPVSAGETWTTELTGVALNNICVRFA
jgi:2-oxo-3-hexenedioate decarboxylase